MIAPKPVALTVTAGVDAVYFTWEDDIEYALVIPPDQARHLAAELLTNADRAENKLPATVYQVRR